MIINLVVITKGAGRVSEVSARFTLDALPGKQMAIDADLNAGLMTPEEAKARRQEVATEADFYGSMDGASKFVKGDRSEEHTSELQSLMRISYAVFCLKKKKINTHNK